MLGFLPLSSTPISSIQSNNVSLIVSPIFSIVGDVWVLSCLSNIWIINKAKAQNKVWALNNKKSTTWILSDKKSSEWVLNNNQNNTWVL